MGMDEIEANIPSHKTTDKEKFALYIDHMSEIEGRMTKFYSQAWHTKLRWKTKVNRQRSEGRLVRNMKDLFGKKAVYIMGDWSDGGHTMKNNQPTKHKGFLTLFKKNHMKRFLLDEYKTSSVCPYCEQALVKNIKKRQSAKPWRKGQMENVHGLLGCNNPKCKKQDWTYRYWNRDMASVINFHRIVEGICDSGERPKIARSISSISF